MKTQIKCIGLDEKVPKGKRFISSWRVEELICTDFEAFKNLEPNNYYKIINPNGTVRSLWLALLGSDSQVDGSSRYLDNDDGVSGVLVVDEVSE